MKFELTSETKEFFGATLFRIRALTSFGSVQTGDLGGWVEKAENLSQDGNAWVFGDAQKTPICVTGLHYSVTITDSEMRIGCELHSHAEWAAFDDERIAKMDGRAARKFWDEHKATLLALCKSHRASTTEDV